MTFTENLKGPGKSSGDFSSLLKMAVVRELLQVHFIQRKFLQLTPATEAPDPDETVDILVVYTLQCGDQ